MSLIAELKRGNRRDCELGGAESFGSAESVVAENLTLAATDSV